MLELIDDLIEKLESIQEAVDGCRQAPWYSYSTWKGVSREELRAMIATVGVEAEHALVELLDLRVLADLAPVNPPDPAPSETRGFPPGPLPAPAATSSAPPDAAPSPRGRD